MLSCPIFNFFVLACIFIYICLSVHGYGEEKKVGNTVTMGGKEKNKHWGKGIDRGGWFHMFCVVWFIVNWFENFGFIKFWPKVV